MIDRGKRIISYGHLLQADTDTNSWYCLEMYESGSQLLKSGISYSGKKFNSQKKMLFIFTSLAIFFKDENEPHVIDVLKKTI